MVQNPEGIVLVISDQANQISLIMEEQLFETSISETNTVQAIGNLLNLFTLSICSTFLLCNLAKLLSCSFGMDMVVTTYSTTQSDLVFGSNVCGCKMKCILQHSAFTFIVSLTAALDSALI